MAVADERDVTAAAVVVVVGLLLLHMRTAISGECLPTRRTTSELKTLTDDLSSSPLPRKVEKRSRSLEGTVICFLCVTEMRTKALLTRVLG